MTERPREAANRLAGETSPYLLQHANNPVDWYPWGEEALEKARTDDKPIFLSIGYAACHWCHVMERESFEDEATAALMNERFVSIKVDREERPDLDGIYMDAVQAMTGQGGWPLSAFLTPDGQPFYAGTYFPPEPRHGMPAFRDLLTGIADAWDERRDEVIGQGAVVARAIERASSIRAGDAALDGTLAEGAADALRRTFDGRWGGFGGAPKFPQPMTLEFLLRRAVRGSHQAREIVTTTLDRMADGGIYDHVGGGFARYSTDERWHVPHFEKMLYDNAQLLQLYARAWLVTGADRYRRVAIETADYLLREMQHPDGGFYSSQDADAGGVEGAFATWRWDDIVGLVGEQVARAFGATPAGNWPGEGVNVLWRPRPLAELGLELGVDAGALQEALDGARPVLFTARETRERPATDDKILAAWNGAAVVALAEAGRTLGDRRYIDQAVRAATFVLAHLRDADGRLRRSWRDGRAGGPAFADDHAAMASACLTLYETTFELSWFEAASSLIADLRERFGDPVAGGYFQTAADAPSLLVRPKELYDNATPSGNSLAADAMLRIAALTGDGTLAEEAAAALRLVADGMGTAPGAFGQALCALDRYVGPTREVAIVGDPAAGETLELVHEVVGARFRPNVVLAVAAADDERARTVVPLLRDRVASEGRATAFVCERFSCRLPVHDPSALRAQLDDVR